MKKDDEVGGGAPAGKQVWTKPAYARIRAGEAELGANPVIAEGFFGKGS